MIKWKSQGDFIQQKVIIIKINFADNFLDIQKLGLYELSELSE